MSLKSLTKDQLIDIIARQEWEINWLKEKENNSRYFEKQVVEKDKEIEELKRQLAQKDAYIDKLEELNDDLYTAAQIETHIRNSVENTNRILTDKLEAQN